jgi:superoxide dismutase, Fe-Mn family
MSTDFTLPSLPYTMSQMEPFLSEETMVYHFHHHHRLYVEKTNELVRGTPFAGMSLEDVMHNSSGELFQNSSQAWNHSFFFFGLTPQTEFERPLNLEIGHQIQKSFGSLDTFQQQFINEGAKLFGSGWVWLVRVEGTERLKIIAAKDADNPMVHGYTPLMVCDVWEHAYYVDYRNERREYLAQFFNAVNWEFVNDNFQRERPRDLTELMLPASA